MSSLALHDAHGKKMKEVEATWLQGPVRKGLLYYAVLEERASRRAGTHATKTRSMVAGSTKKIYRQKGTGNARHGNIRAPIFVGGGSVFGPHPRDYSYRMPKQARRRALQSALLHKSREQQLLVVEVPHWKQIKTKQAAAFFKGFGSSSALLIVDKLNEVLEKSIRNLKGFKLLPINGLNVFDLLKYDQVLVSQEAFSALDERFKDLGN